MKEYEIYICPKCNHQLDESDMGHRCRYCDEWTYTCDCRKITIVKSDVLNLLNEILKRIDGDNNNQ